MTCIFQDVTVRAGLETREDVFLIPMDGENDKLRIRGSSFDLSDGTTPFILGIESSMITKSGLRRLDCLNCSRLFCFANYLEFRIGIEKSL